MAQHCVDACGCCVSAYLLVAQTLGGVATTTTTTAIAAMMVRSHCLDSSSNNNSVNHQLGCRSRCLQWVVLRWKSVASPRRHQHPHEQLQHLWPPDLRLLRHRALKTLHGPPFRPRRLHPLPLLAPSVLLRRRLPIPLDPLPHCRPV